ncbi:MAG: efflux RND transporter periplasmic adaptor subunit [Rhodospirillales bacterium]
MKKIAIRVLALLIVAAAAFWGYRFFQQFQQKQQVIPTAAVRKGDVIIRTYGRGELRAVRSVTLIAPNLFGTVQITKLAPLGSFAREKDLVVEFDDSEVQSRLEEKQLELEQLDEQLKKAQAELEIRNNQDQVDLLRSRFAVQRAQLEVKRNELLSPIDQKKNLLNLEEAQRALKQLESDIKSRLESSQAELAVLREKRNKAVLELNREKMRLRQVKLLSPISGLVAIRQNRGNFMMRGMQLPDLREGDQINPGMPVADVLDLSELEVSAKVGELDRANLHEGQDVRIRLDAVPDKVFHGKIKSLSGTASANVWSGDMAKKFDVVFSVDMKELLSGLGAKPEQIRRILETAERNRKRPGAQAAMMARMGGPGPEGMPGFPGAPGMMGEGGGFGAGPQQSGEGGRMRGERGGRPRGEGAAEGGRMRGEGARAGGEGPEGGPARAGGGMSQEERQKMREAFQKMLAGRNMQDLSPEERQKLSEQMRSMMGGAAGARMGQGRPGRPGGEAGAGSEGPPAFGFQRGPGARGGARGESEGGERGGGPLGMGGEMPFFGGSGGALQFSDADLANAKLPPPPEEDSQLDVLLRPGLLADVEIIVEKIPDAIHIPVQAVFEKEGKLVVFVKHGDEFEERVVKPLKRSESTMVIAEGLNPGELLALADPTASRSARKSDSGKGKKAALPTPGGPGAGGKQ